jgi:TetR/AcrR family transcriptional regulator, regulator of biofilm formation and stress response
MTPNERPRRGSARDAILGATLEVIASNGIDAVTHRRVASQAGVSPGSTTHHFTDRVELLREAFRFYLRLADRFLVEIAEEVRGTPDPFERVRHFVTEIVRREFEHPGEGLIRAEHEMLLFASTDAELAPQVRAWDARWAGFLSADLQAAGRKRPRETARALLNLIRGYELERLLDPGLGIDAFQDRLDAVLGAR